MNNIKPSGAPTCWGRLHQDGEEECRQCRFRYDCRTETMEQVNKPGARLPMFGQYPSQTQLSPPRTPLPALPPPSSTVVPLPPRPVFSPPTTQPPPPARTIPSTTSTPTTVNYSTSAGGYSLPNPTSPNPLAPWYRPGAPGPAYYFTQYPNESVSSRLAKNAVLRALEAIFGELMQFFRHWTWPPKVG